MHPLVSDLNDKQREAVLTTDGPLLIIAGAGSGKTKALTHRIAYLIEEKGVLPEQILAVTFTNKAANEMKERVAKLLSGYRSSLPMMGTFHSICVRLLRKHIHLLGYENTFTIYDGADQLSVMKRLFKERGINEKQCNPRAVLGAISTAKNELMKPEAFARQATGTFMEMVASIYPVYQRILAQSGAVDFDDIIMKTVELFEAHPDVLARYQKTFRYIHVDEYQDTNHAQYTLVTLLAKEHQNICVIGDDWQSIYSWRGANIRNILSFEEEYKAAKVIKLEQNYRSTQTIVQAANAVVRNNSERTDKELWSEKEGEHKVTVLEAANEREEAEKVLQSIMNNLQEPGTRLADFVLLYRTNAQSRILEEACMRHGMPYKIVGGVKFYERKEIKDMLAYLRLTLNPRDSVSFLRIVNVPARKIGAKTLEELGKLATQTGEALLPAIQYIDESLTIGSGAKRSLINFASLMVQLREANASFPASGVMKHVLRLAGYEDMLKDGTEEGEERLKNVQELISVATKYDALEPGISLATFLEEVALVSDLDDLADDDDAITLMTLHASKGLEFPFVYLVGLEEGLFPSSRSTLDPKNLEEERRLMYVGMTRAKDRLYLAFCNYRTLYGSSHGAIPSRFLDEIPEEFLEYDGAARKAAIKSMLDDAFAEVSYASLDEETTLYDAGDVIEHASWGPGKVLSREGDILTVKFQNPRWGTKKLAANVAPIRRIG
ncbi:ATP-dependent DNA helicase PcrA [Candidatus Gracilibacteria bacterium CG17_big_fil_post_rev_8_21_14_2_50_48_13]|nr:MAG: ATP-dependent DNA helicase PcrA [Candidatus Gracilibacteria bacterium CG17_big_fil_post_rev_8_21_14_2_50_48_13]